MTADKTPEGVDPGLWDEFELLSERVHELHRQREIEEASPPPPTRRMVIDVPEEWFLLFAWISGRERRRRHGLAGPTGLTAEHIALYERVMRRAVSSYLWRTLNNDFHVELHLLATGESPLLRPLPPEANRPAPTPGDLDDGIPF